MSALPRDQRATCSSSAATPVHSLQRRHCTAAPAPQLLQRRANLAALRCSPGSTGALEAEPRTSLVPASLDALDSDPDLQRIAGALAAKGQEALTREERVARRRALTSLGLPAFEETLWAHDLPPLSRGTARILQLNIGLYCNQACSHCHVESSPRRTEMMDHATAQRCLQLLERSAGSVQTLDITGGAPELNAEFRYLVTGARALGVEVIDRCNLTVLLEPGQEGLAAFLAQQRVRIVASLPCYSPSNVDKQRGAGVFERSIRGLQLLNEVGYGVEGSGLELDLVYNPGGAFLAPDQAALEAAYKVELWEGHGVRFSRLLALNNLPVKRFADWLASRGQLAEYMALLVDAFNPATVDGLMCRDTVSVGWDGRVFDCDFNQQLQIGVRMHGHASASGAGVAAGGGGKAAVTVFDLERLEQLEGLMVATDSHCYGCTAGAGSSCQGATA